MFVATPYPINCKETCYYLTESNDVLATTQNHSNEQRYRNALATTTPQQSPSNNQKHWSNHLATTKNYVATPYCKATLYYLTVQPSNAKHIHNIIVTTKNTIAMSLNTHKTITNTKNTLAII